MISYQRSTGSWPVTMVERRSWRSSTVSSRSRRCRSSSLSGPQSSRIAGRPWRGRAASWRSGRRRAPGRARRTAWGAVVGDREVLPAGLVAERASQPALAHPGRPDQQQPCRARIHSRLASLRKRPRSRPRAARKSTSSTPARWRRRAARARASKRFCRRVEACAPANRTGARRSPRPPRSGSASRRVGSALAGSPGASRSRPHASGPAAPAQGQAPPPSPATQASCTPAAMAPVATGRYRCEWPCLCDFAHLGASDVARFVCSAVDDGLRAGLGVLATAPSRRCEALVDTVWTCL